MRRAWLAAVLIAAGCEGESRVEIQDRRTPSESRPVPLASAEQRFAVAEMLDGRPSAAPPPAQGGHGHGGAPHLCYDLPPGWEQLPPAPMRDVNLRVPGDAACWVTFLPGVQGGVVDNVNRWRKQLGQPPLDAAGVNALPVVALMGQPAVWFEQDGQFVPEEGQAPRPTRFVGMIQEQQGGLLTVKLVGSPESAAAAREGLLRFAASLRIDGGR